MVPTLRCCNFIQLISSFQSPPFNLESIFVRIKLAHFVELRVVDKLKKIHQYQHSKSTHRTDVGYRDRIKDIGLDVN